MTMRQPEFEATRACAVELDRNDNMRSWRDEFFFPDKRNSRTAVYFCGNSLGLQPRRAAQYVNEELDSWARRGINGHFSGKRPWLSYHRYATDVLADLCGAHSDEVIAMNTLTVNLHLLMATFFRPQGARRKILIESTAFPSDRYAVVSQLSMHGIDTHDGLLEWRPPAGETDLRLEDLERLVADNAGSIALILLPGVQYYNGQVMNMPALCDIARRAGCPIGLDLAHAVGNVPLALHDWGADFAAWCTYKYLNSGPGAVGGAFVHRRHLAATDRQPLRGWWGNHEGSRFRMARDFDPAPGIESWQVSNPPVLALAPLVASLELFREAGFEQLQQKSQRLTAWLAFLLDAMLPDAIRIITPQHERGCQLSLTVVGGTREPKSAFAQLDPLNVIVDWREPDVIRAAPAPLYNGFEEAYEFVQRLKLAIGG